MLPSRIKPPICLLFAAASAFAQSPPSPAASSPAAWSPAAWSPPPYSPAALVFDVASVRPSKPDAAQHTDVPLDSGNVYSTLSPEDARTAASGYLVATHQPLWRYIVFAFKLSGTQELALRFNMFSGAQIRRTLLGDRRLRLRARVL